MKNDHVIETLDGHSAARLSEGALARIESHVGECADCRRAFQASRISSDLLHCRADQTTQPSPFFSKRVMAAIRSRVPSERLTPATMWRYARALVAAMMVVVAFLAILSFQAGTGPEAQLAAIEEESIYSAERVILTDADASEDLTYGEVLATLYE